MYSTLDPFNTYHQQRGTPPDDIWKFVRAMVFLLGTALVIALCGCKTKTVVVETVRTDTTYITKQQRDSIWLHDSVYLHEYQRGETIYVEHTKWHTAWRERLIHDSIYIAKRDTLIQTREVPRNLTWWQRTSMRMGWLLMLLLAVATTYGALRLWRKFRP